MGSSLISRPYPLVASLPRINDADHPLGAGMDVNVADLNGLLVTAPAFKSSRRFPPSSALMLVNPVMFPPGAVQSW
jgi:hypothetical protein